MDAEGRSQEGRQDEALKQAEDAAAAGDPVGTVENLHRSFYLDGLTRRLRRRWERLSVEDVKDAVAEAVNALYYSIRDDKKILDIKGYLWKAADNKANDRYRLQRRERTVALEDLDRISSQAHPPAEDEYMYGRSRIEEPDLSLGRARAISTARKLLPRLGGENIQQVMGYILDAIEADQLHIPNQEIAEALGLSNQTIRQSRSRGFRRLEREGRKEGLVLPTLGIVEAVPEDE